MLQQRENWKGDGKISIIFSWCDYLLGKLNDNEKKLQMIRKLSKLAGYKINIPKHIIQTIAS